jgi:signal transduction histidine kinase
MGMLAASQRASRSCALWCLGVLLALACMAARAAQHIEVAEVSQQPIPGQFSSGPFLSPLKPLKLPDRQGMRPPEDAAWSTVALPDADGENLQADVRVRRPVSWFWYRMAIDCSQWVADRRAHPQDITVVYIPRSPSGGLHLWWQLPGAGWALLKDQRGLGLELWNQPVWWDLPIDTVAQTDQACASKATTASVHMALTLPHGLGTPRVLSSVWVGPRAELHPRWVWRTGLQHTLPAVVSLSILVMGVFALAAWLRQRHEFSYLLFALCSAVWVLRNLHLWCPVPTDVVWAGWYWWLAKATPPWFLVLTFCFAYRFMPWRYPRVEQALLGLALALTVLTMPLMGWPMETTLVEYGLVLGVAAVSTSVMTRDAFRRGASREFRLLTLQFWLGLALGTHDLLMIVAAAPVEDVMLVPLITLGFTGCFLYALHRRHMGTVDDLATLNRELEQRVAAQRQDIERSHARLREVEQAEARMAERQRLMRDMHDGVGSSLITALAMVERRPMPPKEVAQVLRECLDDLRMVIESMEPEGQDIGMLLGSLRHRLGKRLVLSGLQVDWEVGELPQLSWLQPTEALQFLRLMQEALTNVIKHAHATQLTVRIVPEGALITVRVEDNGRGFDVRHRGNGHGLLNMASRARRLGGRLALDSAPGRGTRLILQLPVVRQVATEHSWRKAS